MMIITNKTSRGAPLTMASNVRPSLVHSVLAMHSKRATFVAILVAVTLVLSSTNVCADSTTSKPIPNVVHFVKADTMPMKYVEYLAVRLASIRIKPTKIIFWTGHGDAPTGKWWSMASRYCSQVRAFPTQAWTLISDLTSSKGLRYAAHLSDIVRLEVLSQYGGIYLDLDVMALASFGDLLRPWLSGKHKDQYPTVLGWEKIVPGYHPVVGVAVIVSPPQAEFIQQWRKLLPTEFDASCYTCHSTALATKLVQSWSMQQGHVRTVDWENFYFPGWEQSAANFLFENATDSETPEHTWQLFNVARAVHLFGSLLGETEKNGRWSTAMTPRSIRSNATRIGRLITPALS